MVSCRESAPLGDRLCWRVPAMCGEEGQREWVKGGRECEPGDSPLVCVWGWRVFRAEGLPAGRRPTQGTAGAPAKSLNLRGQLGK